MNPGKEIDDQTQQPTQEAKRARKSENHDFELIGQEGSSKNAPSRPLEVAAIGAPERQAAAEEAAPLAEEQPPGADTSVPGAPSPEETAGPSGNHCAPGAQLEPRAAAEEAAPLAEEQPPGADTSVPGAPNPEETAGPSGNHCAPGAQLEPRAAAEEAAPLAEEQPPGAAGAPRPEETAGPSRNRCILEAHFEIQAVEEAISLAGEHPPGADTSAPGDPRPEEIAGPSGSRCAHGAQLGSLEQDCPEYISQFIREQWGLAGTFTKIMAALEAGTSPITVQTLIARGPTLPGYTSRMAVSCFYAIFDLKKLGLITIIKHPARREIMDITLGPTIAFIDRLLN